MAALPPPSELRRVVRRRACAARAAVRPPAAIGAYLQARPGRAYLHVGCGGARLDGWLNTDRDAPAGATHLDVTRRFPLPDAAFDRVLSEHVIEHVPLEAGRHMLRECARVLRPGGRVRVSTPDLAVLARIPFTDDADSARYRDWAAHAFTPGARGTREALVLNTVFRNWGHQFLYDEGTLRRALEDAGFADVSRQPYRRSDDAVFDGAEGRGIDAIGLEMRTFETLALEARRA